MTSSSACGRCHRSDCLRHRVGLLEAQQRVPHWLVGGPVGVVLGAVIGGGAGALTGASTGPQDLNLEAPPWSDAK